MPGPQELPRHQYQRMAAPRISKTTKDSLDAKLDITYAKYGDRALEMDIYRPRDAWGTLPGHRLYPRWRLGQRQSHQPSQCRSSVSRQRICDRHDFLPAQWRSPLPRRYPGLQSSRSIPPGKMPKAMESMPTKLERLDTPPAAI